MNDTSKRESRANETLSRESGQKIEKMVERVARKAGYTGQGELTYREHLQYKFDQKREKLVRKAKKYRHKFSVHSKKTDFAEEIETYIRDGVLDLIKQGHSEEDALKITMEKFDEADLKGDFEDMMHTYDNFGMNEHWQQFYQDNGEAVGLFYAAFVILGLTVGGLIGFLGGHTLISAALGSAVGLGIGIGLGLLSHGIFAAAKRK